MLRIRKLGGWWVLLIRIRKVGEWDYYLRAGTWFKRYILGNKAGRTESLKIEVI